MKRYSRSFTIIAAAAAVLWVIVAGMLNNRASLTVAELPTQAVLPVLTAIPNDTDTPPTATTEPIASAIPEQLALAPTQVEGADTIAPDADTILVSEPNIAPTLIIPIAQPSNLMPPTASALVPLAIAGTPIPQEPVPGQVILRFEPDTTQQEREDYIASIGGTVTENIDAIDTVVVELPAVPSASAQSLPDSPLVVEQEPDYFVVALQDGAPNDPRYAEQWALPAIGAPQAWVTLNNVNSIRIAVIDSGVCADHPDLAGRIVAGWDFVQGDDTPQDEFGHGCNIAGVIAANMNDDIGIAGVAPNAQIMPLRILDAHGIGRYSDVAAAVVYAADHDAQIINLSVGGVNASDMLEDAIDYAIGKGIIVIAAAGNAGTEQVLYPAAYAPVIAVGSIGRDLQRSSFSNYGAGVDVYAPGSDILTTTRSGGYGSVSGTSFAAPHVAAAAALEIARGGTLTLGGTLTVSGIDSTPPTAAPTQIVAPTATIASETPPVTVDTNQLYYYYEDQRIPLTISSDWIAVRFDSSDLNAQAQVAAQGAGSTVSALANFADAVQIPNPPLTLVPLNSGVGPQSVVALVNSLRASDDVQWANPVFDSQTGDAILTEQFIAQFNGSASDADIDALNTQHGVEVVQPLVGVSNGYILRVTEASDHDALAMANLYHESSLTVYAEPNFVQYMPPLATANDSLFGSQWAFNNTGQFGGSTPDADIDAVEAWDISTGSSNIIIAVIDEGVDLGHPDLDSKIVGGYDATTGDSDATSNTWDGHGTAVSGLAAAESNNSQGVAGVCQACRIMPVRVAYSAASGGNWVTNNAWLADGINWAWQNGAHILSNSWGGGTPSTTITNAITAAQNNGRGGLGSVVLFAAGNGNGPVSYPGSLTQVITISASNLCDQRKVPTANACNFNESWWGSSYGSQVDVAAPGVGNYTTDMRGSSGYTSGDYIPNFNGTSSATPITSGVVGLMLSIDGSLTYSQVSQMLRDTADDVNAATNPGFDNELGAGRINAFRAVQAASGIIPPPTPPPSDLIFADSLESGNFSTWTSSTTDSGDLSVITGAALVGTRGMRALIDSNGAIYVTDDTPSAETRYRARFYFDPNSITMGNGNTHVIFYGYTGSSTGVISLEFRRSSNLYQLRPALRSDGSSWLSGNWFTISDAPHSFEIDWRASTSTSARNGSLTLWIDGTQQSSQTGIDNDTRRIDRVRLGAVDSVDSGTRGTTYFDAFESRDSNYIGPASTTPPVPPTATYTPSITLTPSVTLTPSFTPVVNDVIFADSFESGNVSAWTSSVTDSSDLSVTAGAALVGSRGMSLLIDDNAAIYVTDDTPGAESRYRVRFYFDPNSISMGDGNNHVIFYAYAGSTTGVISLEFRFSSDLLYQIRPSLATDSTSWLLGTWATISDAPHYIEMDWRASTSSSAKNGSLTMWVDGVQQSNQTGADNDTRRIDRVRLGALESIDSATRGTYYFDAFDSREASSIGPALAGLSTSEDEATATAPAPAMPSATLLPATWTATPTLTLPPPPTATMTATESPAPTATDTLVPSETPVPPTSTDVPTEAPTETLAATPTEPPAPTDEPTEAESEPEPETIVEENAEEAPLSEGETSE